MNLVEKQSEIYAEINKINEMISKLLEDYKNFEAFNKLYIQKEELWKKYNFYKKLLRCNK